MFKLPLSARQANLIVKLNELNALSIPSFLDFIVSEIDNCTKTVKHDEVKKNVNHPGIIAGILSKIIAKDGEFVGQVAPEVMNKVWQGVRSR